ncbi:MAG: aromatase [Actinomycetota bacterium]|nr:aromatase [Actinomycetota bacterium]
MREAERLVSEALCQAGVAEDEIRPDAALKADLGVDSAELVEVLAILRRRTNASIPAQAIKKVRTVEELIGLVEASRVTAGLPNGESNGNGHRALHHTEHAISIEASVDRVYGILADLKGYERLFPPTQSVEILDEGSGYQVGRLVVDVGGRLQSWVTRRELDAQRALIRYRQIETAPLIGHMSGEWRCYPLGGSSTQLVLTHDFVVREPLNGRVAGLPVEQAEEALSGAVERNSHADLAAVKAEAERIGATMPCPI